MPNGTRIDSIWVDEYAEWNVPTPILTKQDEIDSLIRELDHLIPEGTPDE